MTIISRVVFLGVLLSVGATAGAQESAADRKSIPDSLNYMRKKIEKASSLRPAADGSVGAAVA